MAQSTKISFQSGSIETPTGNYDPTIPRILPHEQVFSIQVGDSLFRLSGASLSSDGPSYFTSFFLPYADKPESERPTLYLDRSAKVFSHISQHLRGYYIVPENDSMIMWLLSDAHYYHLPRLIKQLSKSEILVRIGCRLFRIPRDIFSSPGDSPNFFTIGFGTLFGAEIYEKKKSMPKFLRPPPMAPPIVTNRSGDLFDDLINVLRGQDIRIRSDEHREALIRECRYYRLRGLEQRLVPHSINPVTVEPSLGMGGHQSYRSGEEEIVLNLRHIKLKQLQTGLDPAIVYYKRPFVDEPARQLVTQLKDISVALDTVESMTSELVDANGQPIELYKVTVLQEKYRSEFTDLLISTSETLQGSHNRTGTFVARIDHADVTLLDETVNINGKRALASSSFVLTTSQWRLSLLGGELVLELLKGRGYSSEGGRNRMREFL